MTRFFTLAAAALVAVSTQTAPAHADAAPITSLEQCYQAVITWCTETFPDHADQCGSSSGLDDCDEEFGNTAATPGINRIGPAVPPRTFARLISGAQRHAAATGIIVRR
ncbi:MAG: hypothetical protein H6898_06265 [Rhodobacter sp.]|nr:hypothetical protein [Rhodobacter sp.]